MITRSYRSARSHEHDQSKNHPNPHHTCCGNITLFPSFIYFADIFAAFIIVLAHTILL